jgi:hypothetical protein
MPPGTASRRNVPLRTRISRCAHGERRDHKCHDGTSDRSDRCHGGIPSMNAMGCLNASGLLHVSSSAYVAFRLPAANHFKIFNKIYSQSVQRTRPFSSRRPTTETTCVTRLWDSEPLAHASDNVEFVIFRRGSSPPAVPHLPHEKRCSYMNTK